MKTPSRTLTGSGGTAADFRRAAAGIQETADALTLLSALFDAIAAALDEDNATAAYALLEQLPGAYLRAGREVTAIEGRVAPLREALGLAARMTANPPRK